MHVVTSTEEVLRQGTLSCSALVSDVTIFLIGSLGKFISFFRNFAVRGFYGKQSQSVK